MLLRLCAFIGIAGTAFAESVPVVSGSDANGFYAQYELVEDHPECSGAGQVAFQVPFEARDLTFQIDDIMRRQTAYITQEEAIFDQRCFVTQGRLTGRLEVEITCSENTPNNLRTGLDAVAIDLDLKANTTICMSPAGANLLESDWTATVRTAEKQQVYEGVFASQVDRAGDSGELSQPRAWIDYGVLVPEQRTKWQREESTRQAALRDAARMNIFLSCLAFVDEEYSTDPLFMSTTLVLFLFDQPQLECTGADCPRSISRYVRSHYYYTNDCEIADN